MLSECILNQYRLLCQKIQSPFEFVFDLIVVDSGAPGEAGRIKIR